MGSIHSSTSVSSTFVGTVADRVTIDQVWATLDITNHDTVNTLWYRQTGTTTPADAVASGSGCIPVLPLQTVTISGIATPDNTIVLSVVGSGGGYTVAGVSSADIPDAFFPSLVPAPTGNSLSDRLMIEAAIAAKSAMGGGDVLLSEAYSSNPYLVDVSGAPHYEGIHGADNVCLRGQQKHSTWVRLIGDPPTLNGIFSMRGLIGACVDDMTIDGDKATNVSLAAVTGIFGSGSINCRVGSNVRVTGCSLHGIMASAASLDFHVDDNVEVDDWGGVNIGCGVVIFNGSLRARIGKVKLDNTSSTGAGVTGVLIDASSSGGGGVSCDGALVEGATVLGCGTAFQVEDSHRATLIGCNAYGFSSFGYVVQEGQDHLPPISTRIIGCTAYGAGGQSVGMSDGGQWTTSEGFFAANVNVMIRVVESNGARLCIGNTHSSPSASTPTGTAPIAFWFRGSLITFDNPKVLDGSYYKGIAQVSGATSVGNMVKRAVFGTVTTSQGAIHSESGSRFKVYDAEFGNVTGNGVVLALGTTSATLNGNDGTVSGTREVIDGSVTILPFVQA